MLSAISMLVPQTSRSIAFASIASSLAVHAAGIGAIVWLAAGVSHVLRDAHLASRPGAAITVTVVSPPVAAAPEEPVTLEPRPEAPADVKPPVTPISRPVPVRRVELPPAQYIAVVSPNVDAPALCEEGSPRERHASAPQTPQSPAQEVVEKPILRRAERAAPKPPAPSFVAIPTVAGVENREGPTFVDNPPPQYPPVAVARRWQGEVVVRVWIGADGRVQRAEVDRSSGFAVLDEAALKAVRQWRARAAREQGQAVETVELQPIVFRLDRR